MPFPPSLAERRCEPEIMDDPTLAADRHEQALRGLSRVNRLSNSAGIVWRPIRRLSRELSGEPLRVLDVATGGGDVPLRLWRRARRAGVPLELTGADVSPRALQFARRRAQEANAPLDFVQLNALEDPLPAGYDVVMCSLFLHHLSRDDALSLLRKMAASARRLVLVNDLARSRLGWLSAAVGVRLLSASPVVHVDGPLSVQAAFSLPEARQLAQQAGLDGAAIERRWPFRYLLQWRKE